MKPGAYTPAQLQASITKPNWIVRRELRDDKSQASNPCQTRFDIGHYFRCYPAMLLFMPFVLVCMLAVVWWQGLDWRIGLPVSVIVALACAVTIVKTMMKKFAVGDVVPGFVLDNSHIIVFVNLAAETSEPRNAAKVIYAPVAKMSGGPYRKGDRVPATCLYAGPPDSSAAWTNVHPFAVAAGTVDLVALARLEMSISEQDWAEAKQYTDQIKSNKPELHRFW